MERLRAYLSQRFDSTGTLDNAVFTACTKLLGTGLFGDA